LGQGRDMTPPDFATPRSNALYTVSLPCSHKFRRVAPLSSPIAKNQTTGETCGDFMGGMAIRLYSE
jgi:hypothetical protein